MVCFGNTNNACRKSILWTLKRKIEILSSKYETNFKLEARNPKRVFRISCLVFRACLEFRV